jgi:CheY-like chemotaxis protein
MEAQMHNATAEVKLASGKSRPWSPAGPACVSPAPASNARVPTILLVEDEAFVGDVAYEILCSSGYRVLQARNAADALRAFRGHAEGVQLLLTDVVLPDRNGSDLALELVTAGGYVKAMFISGYPENSITKKGLQHPGWFYLPKPRFQEKVSTMDHPPPIQIKNSCDGWDWGLRALSLKRRAGVWAWSAGLRV